MFVPNSKLFLTDCAYPPLPMAAISFSLPICSARPRALLPSAEQPCARDASTAARLAAATYPTAFRLAQCHTRFQKRNQMHLICALESSLKERRMEG
jgi:hypothetical protein